MLSALQVVVEEGRAEAGFVARVEEGGALAVVASDADGAGSQAWFEHRVEPRFGCVGAAH